MLAASLARRSLRPAQCAMIRSYASDTRSSGSVREAGGSFAKKEAAVEDQYFRRQDAEKLKRIQTNPEDKKAAEQATSQDGKNKKK